VPNGSASERFADSVPALYLGPHAAAVFSFGRVVALAEGGEFACDDPARLHVVLEGALEDGRGWLGPGNHFAGGGLRLRVIGASALLWTLDRGRVDWNVAAAAPLRLALQDALRAADRALAAATPPSVLPDPATLCDVGHPAIRDRAHTLRRSSDAATAEAIYCFVQPMPYRFGAWQERASDTLARGVGMCTTKANLQVALLRAAGLEAGFVETPLPLTVLGRLMPPAWLGFMRPIVRHYFCAVKLGGRWHPADASYNDDSLGVYVESFPHLADCRHGVFGEGRPFSPAAVYAERDPFDVTVVDHLNEQMGKASRFSVRHFEALNTRLDRVQRGWRQWLAVDRRP
jgi:hypothetical protein